MNNSKLHDAMEEYAQALIAEYDGKDTQELVEEVTCFYAAMLATFGVDNFNYEAEGGTTISGANLCAIYDKKTKPTLELVH